MKYIDPTKMDDMSATKQTGTKPLTNFKCSYVWTDSTYDVCIDVKVADIFFNGMQSTTFWFSAYLTILFTYGSLYYSRMYSVTSHKFHGLLNQLILDCSFISLF